MADPQQELTFNQYSVLANQILAQQRQIDALQKIITERLDDLDDRTRRNEFMVVVGFFLIVLSAVITFFLVRDLLIHG